MFNSGVHPDAVPSPGRVIVPGLDGPGLAAGLGWPVGWAR